MIERILLGLAGLFLLAGPAASAQNTGYYPKGGPDVAAEDVSLIHLIANPKTYDGKLVRITGYLRIEPDGNVIYLHREDFEYVLSKNGIWINLPKDMTKEQVEILNDHYVVCTGRFIASQNGPLDMNSGEIDDVTRIQIWPFGPKTGSSGTTSK